MEQRLVSLFVLLFALAAVGLVVLISAEVLLPVVHALNSAARSVR